MTIVGRMVNQWKGIITRSEHECDECGDKIPPRSEAWTEPYFPVVGKRYICKACTWRVEA